MFYSSASVLQLTYCKTDVSSLRFHLSVIFLFRLIMVFFVYELLNGNLGKQGVNLLLGQFRIFLALLQLVPSDEREWNFYLLSVSFYKGEATHNTREIIML